MLYAIVDIETTGGSAQYHKITEIAIIIHNGREIVERFESLINPERFIPPGITALTGISNEMVEDAPKFIEVAQKVLEITEDKIFVAHSANFDYTFLKKEFAEIGEQFQRKKLCTVRLSRKILPGLPSYSLGNLCSSLRIPIHNRHRAGGDAEATAHLMTMLVAKDQENFISHSLNRNSKEALMPPNLPKSQYDSLPQKNGVYYFHDKAGKVVYVGKANNIKSRVTSHFSGNTNTKSRQLFLNTIFSVSYEVCGNELIAFLLENEEIKKHWPRYNRSYKGVTLNCGIYQYEDQSGFQRLCIGKAGKRDKPILTFKNISETTTYLLAKVKSYNLCLRLCGIIDSEEKCLPDEKGWTCPVCHGKSTFQIYNKKFDLAVSSFKQSEKSFVIIGSGKEKEESSVVVVENGRYLGFGYIPREESVTSFHSFKDYLRSCYDNQDVQGLINSSLKKYKAWPQEGFIIYKNERAAF